MMKRATWLGMYLGGLLCVGAVLAASSPNIVFLFSDDHALRTIGAYEGSINRTPNMDRLAKEGALFTRSFCVNSICCPSRAAILTGKHSHLNGVQGNGSRFNRDQFLFPRPLRAAGYRTALIGKWHLAGNDPGDAFDHWMILSGAGGQGHYFNPEFKHQDGHVEQVPGYSADVITDRSLAWLEGQKESDQPFLLMCQFKAPHIHRIPPVRHMDDYDGKDLPEPETLFDDYANRNSYAAKCWMALSGMQEHVLNIVPPQGECDINEKPHTFLGRMSESQRAAYHAAYDPDNARYREMKAAGRLEGEALTRYKYQRFIKDYLGCVSAIDDNIGRILAWLEAEGLADNTMVIYSSDQGFFTGEHGWAEKRWMYEESFMMPLIMRWPGRIAPGTRIDALVQNIDYAPTLLDIAGVEIPDEIQGRSLQPLFGGKVPADWRRSIYYHYYDDRAYNLPRFEGVRNHRWKLIHYYRPTEEWELFDLKQDPQEMNSLAADPARAKQLDRMKAQLQKLRTQYRLPALER